MGCGSSKGVAPEPPPAQLPAQNKDAPQPMPEKRLSAAGAKEPVPLLDAPDKHQHQLQEASLPGCTQSAAASPREAAVSMTSLVGSQPAQHSHQAPAVAPPEPEFDYSKELQHAGSLSNAAPLGPLSSGLNKGSSTAPLPAPNTAVVGGVLSRQPDWLAVPDAAASAPAPEATFSNSLSGGTASAAAGANPGHPEPPSMRVLPPLAPRGAAAVGLANNPLPPIHQGLFKPVQQPIPSEPQPQNKEHGTLHPATVGGMLFSEPSGQAGLQKRVSGGGASVQTSVDASSGKHTQGHVQQQVDLPLEASAASATSAAARVSHDSEHHRLQQHEAKQGSPSARSSQSGSSSSSCHSSSSRHATPPQAAAAAVHSSHGDPSDPWSALQSQYVAGSPGSSMAGSPPQVAGVAASSHGHHQQSLGTQGHGSSLPPVQGAAAKHQSAGARRASNTAAAAGGERELVLVDSDEGEDSSRDGYVGGSSSARGHHHNRSSSGSVTGLEQQHLPTQIPIPAAAAAGATEPALRSSRSSNNHSSSRLSADLSSNGLGAGDVAQVKPGNWGVGSFAGAGTLMLGEQAPKAAAAKHAVSATAAAHDDVFGDEHDEGGGRHGNPGSAAVAAESSSHSNHMVHAHLHVGSHNVAGAAADEPLGIEEMEDDVDALIEEELGKIDGLPADLAAKLAQFEAMGAEDEGGHHGRADGSGSDGEGPSVYELMNHKQSSWQAA